VAANAPATAANSNSIRSTIRRRRINSSRSATGLAVLDRRRTRSVADPRRPMTSRSSRPSPSHSYIPVVYTLVYIPPKPASLPTTRTAAPAPRAMRPRAGVIGPAQAWLTGGLSASVRVVTRAAAARGLDPRSQDAIAPTSIMTTENANVMCMPTMNGLLIRFGKNV
jgi:hypothetical protein